jgi:hypothetical protein
MIAKVIKIRFYPAGPHARVYNSRLSSDQRILSPVCSLDLQPQTKAKKRLKEGKGTPKAIPKLSWGILRWME